MPLKSELCWGLQRTDCLPLPYRMLCCGICKYFQNYAGNTGHTLLSTSCLYWLLVNTFSHWITLGIIWTKHEKKEPAKGLADFGILCNPANALFSSIQHNIFFLSRAAKSNKATFFVTSKIPRHRANIFLSNVKKCGDKKFNISYQHWVALAGRMSTFCTAKPLEKFFYHWTHLRGHRSVTLCCIADTVIVDVSSNPRAHLLEKWVISNDWKSWLRLHFGLEHKLCNLIG